MRLGSPERLFSELPSKPVLGNPEGKRHKKGAEVLSLSFNPKACRSASVVDIGDRRGHDGSPWTPPPNPCAPSATRSNQCFDRRSDALFELTDALLTAGSVPSPIHLSLAPAHRR